MPLPVIFMSFFWPILIFSFFLKWSWWPHNYKRHCATGEGMFIFHTLMGERIYRKVHQATLAIAEAHQKSKRQTCRSSSPSSSSSCPHHHKQHETCSSSISNMSHPHPPQFTTTSPTPGHNSSDSSQDPRVTGLDSASSFYSVQTHLTQVQDLNELEAVTV